MDQRGELLMVPERVDAETVSVPVLAVHDGDGFLTRIKHPISGTEFRAAIRFGFIDAPEVGQPGADEARDFLQSLIGGKWLDIAILTKMDTGGIVDRHGRIVCVPYLCEEHALEPKPSYGGITQAARFWKAVPVMRNIELEMVLNGWAWVLERYGPDERYLEALNDARRHKRGIWSRDDNVHPWEFKKQQYRAKQSKRDASQPTLFSPPAEKARCPVAGCDGHIVERSGKFGTFLGCSRFPGCRHSQSLAE